MDPHENIKRQRELAEQIGRLRTIEELQDNYESMCELAELVLALDGRVVGWTYAEALQLVRDFNENATDNPEYLRGQLELMADLYPVVGMACGDRAREIGAELFGASAEGEAETRRRWYVYAHYDDGGGPYAAEVQATDEQDAIAEALKQAHEDNEAEPGTLGFIYAQAVEPPTPAPLYVVEVFERNDGIYLFQREEDAKAFEAAVNGDSLYTLPRCNLLETPVITHEMSVALIAAESEA